MTLNWIEILAVCFGIIYLFLAAKEKIICWIFGILSCTFWAIAVFQIQLYADAVLQLFYVGMGFYGLYTWRFGSTTKSVISITRIPLKGHVLILTMGIILTLPIAFYLENYTNAIYSYLDTFTTIFSIIATFLTAWKKLENWLYWIVLDLLYVYIYFRSGASLFMILFIVYSIVAFFAWLDWRHKFINTETQAI